MLVFTMKNNITLKCGKIKGDSFNYIFPFNLFHNFVKSNIKGLRCTMGCSTLLTREKGLICITMLMGHAP